jgi:hypothetical protein
MAYYPEDRIARMKELMKPIDSQIMMCDDVQDLFALASAMAVTSKNIFVKQLGEQGTKEIFRELIKDL